MTRNTCIDVTFGAAGVDVVAGGEVVGAQGADFDVAGAAEMNKELITLWHV